MPGGPLTLDSLPFLALLEGLLRERGEEAEKAINDLYDEAAPLPPSTRERDRAKQIARMMRFGG